MKKNNWDAIFSRPSITMLFLGFSAGIPILLIFSSLSLWLQEAGIEKSKVTYFSWAALGYSFKFIWAPLVDKLPLPFLTKLLGRRRSWLLLTQILVIASIVGMALIDPSLDKSYLKVLALATVALGFSSASQDIVIDAYRIESANDDLQAFLASTYITGYRIGMFVAGAGALWLADWFGSTKEVYVYSAWSKTYLIMAATMFIGIITTLIMREPDFNQEQKKYSTNDYLRFLSLFIIGVLSFIAVFYYSSEIVSTNKKILKEIFGNKHLASFLIESTRILSATCIAILVCYTGAKVGIVRQEMISQTYVDPLKDFFEKNGFKLALLFLSLIACYRISDIVLGVISNIFYQDMGFTKTQIANAVKGFGLWMTIVGGFVGGILANKYGVMRILFLGALLSAATNLLFVMFAVMGDNINFLYLVVTFDNLSAGIASTAFIAFLSRLTSVSFTAIQYAIFSSLMTLFPKILGGYSGSIVESIGYPNFFILTTILGIPALVLIIILQRLEAKKT